MLSRLVGFMKAGGDDGMVWWWRKDGVGKGVRGGGKGRRGRGNEGGVEV